MGKKTNGQNCIYDSVKIMFSSRNIFCHSNHSLPCSCLHCKNTYYIVNVRIRISVWVSNFVTVREILGWWLLVDGMPQEGRSDRGTDKIT